MIVEIISRTDGLTDTQKHRRNTFSHHYASNGKYTKDVHLFHVERRINTDELDTIYVNIPIIYENDSWQDN